MSRISLKIVSSIVSSIFLVAVCIGTISLVRASSIIKEETALKFLHMSENYSNRFSSFLSGVEKTVLAFSATVAAGFDSDNFRNDESYRNDFMSQINRSLLNIAEHNGSIQGIYCVINPEITGEVYESWFISSGGNSFVYQEPEDISTFYPENEDMKWYYDPIMNRSGIWSLPYTDATIDVKMVSYTHAIYADEQLIGVAGIDLFFSDMFRTVSEMVFYNSGYGILTDSEYNIIVHTRTGGGLQSHR